MAKVTTIEAFIDELIGVLDGIAGLKFVPDDPPDNISQSPFAVVHLQRGRGKLAPMGGTMVTYHDNVAIHVGVPLQDMARANEIILPIGRQITNCIFSSLVNLTLTPANFTELSYDYGPFQWGGVWMFGWSIIIGEVKTQATL